VKSLWSAGLTVIVGDEANGETVGAVAASATDR